VPVNSRIDEFFADSEELKKEYVSYISSVLTHLCSTRSQAKLAGGWKTNGQIKCFPTHFHIRSCV
jgi:hypothetical protein